MPVNGSEIIQHPWDEIMSPFTDMLGMGFYLVPLGFIAVALYLKTRNTVVPSLFMLASGSLLSTSSIWVGYEEAAIFYILFTAMGLVGTIISLFFMKK